jgi:hypothetical protein
MISKKKKKVNEDAAASGATPLRAKSKVSAGATPKKQAEKDIFEIPNTKEQVNARELETLADQIFGSVLSKFGWARDEQGRVEHVGGGGR